MSKTSLPVLLTLSLAPLVSGCPEKSSGPSDSPAAAQPADKEAPSEEPAAAEEEETPSEEAAEDSAEEEGGW